VASKSLKKDHGVLSDKVAYDHAMKKIDDVAHHELVKVSSDPHPAAHIFCQPSLQKRDSGKCLAISEEIEVSDGDEHESSQHPPSKRRRQKSDENDEMRKFLLERSEMLVVLESLHGKISHQIKALLKILESSSFKELSSHEQENLDGSGLSLVFNNLSKNCSDLSTLLQESNGQLWVSSLESSRPKIKAASEAVSEAGIKFEEFMEQFDDLKSSTRKEKARARSVCRLATKSDLPFDANFPSSLAARIRELHAKRKEPSMAAVQKIPKEKIGHCYLCQFPDMSGIKAFFDVFSDLLQKDVKKLSDFLDRPPSPVALSLRAIVKGKPEMPLPVVIYQ
jgi:hypothetical protein